MRCEYRLPSCGQLRRVQLGTGPAPLLTAVPCLAVLEFDLIADGALIVVVIDVSVSLAYRVPGWYASHWGQPKPAGRELL
jgi:hypothetical protein